MTKTKTNEWYTPPRFVESARRVLVAIDLDPASCETANRTVQATRYYTKQENGLLLPWHGRVFLNPPYGKTERGHASNLEQFTRRLISEYQCGNVSAAVLLIPASTATRWFDALWQYPICFPRFRIRFVDQEGRASDGVSFGTCFVYLGQEERRFVEEFRQYGQVARALTTSAMLIEPELWAAS